MIEIRDLRKSFSRTQVLKGLDLDLEKGKVYGLIGRNGVGKTTLLNLIAGGIKKDSGSILLDGEEIYERQAAMEQIALIRDNGNGSTDKVKKLIQSARILYKNWNEDKYKILLEEFDFEKNLKKSSHKLSRGNRSILGIIIGIASDSEYLFLDEPGLGLDPVYKDRFRQAIYKEMEEGERTIVISTHAIDDSISLFEEVIVLDKGLVSLKDSIENIGERSYSIVGDEEVLDRLLASKRIIKKESLGNTKIYSILDHLNQEERQELLDQDSRIESLSLEKLFIYLTEE